MGAVPASSTMVNPFFSRSGQLTLRAPSLVAGHSRNFYNSRRVVSAQAQSQPTGASPKLPWTGKTFYKTLTTAPTKLIESSGVPSNILAATGVVAVICVLLFVRDYLRKSRNEMGGSVSDLIRRGQLRSDRKADLRPLKYEDPFNNPLVKVGSKNPIVRMCGKIFRLQPVTLTEEKVVSHQNRRIQAYQWRRPVVFLNEGDPVPEGIDPEEVRWIPSNHPFATTKDFIDEESAQKNVYQTRGVPSRLRAEHEALRRKMREAAEKVQFDPPQDGNLPHTSRAGDSDRKPAIEATESNPSTTWQGNA